MPPLSRRFLVLVSAALVMGCTARAPLVSDADGGASSSAPSSSAPSSSAPSSEVGAKSEPARDLLEIFLEAAKSDGARPHPVSEPSSKPRYFEAAEALLGGGFGDRSSVEIIASALARSPDPRATKALIEWAVAERTSSPHRVEALRGMRNHPRAGYLEAVKSILAQPELASIVVVTTAGAYCAALEVGAKVSLHGFALEVAAALPGEEGKALLRRLAEDRSLTEPDPRTLAALTCEPGKKRVEDEAKAVASLRLMALSMLQDRGLMKRMAKDASEPALARRWATRMFQGKPPSPDARAKRTWRGPPGEDPVRMPWLAPSPCP